MLILVIDYEGDSTFTFKLCSEDDDGDHGENSRLLYQAY
jgi:hypothetical protein